MPEKKASNAARPPAEAPMPTMGKDWGVGAVSEAEGWLVLVARLGVPRLLFWLFAMVVAFGCKSVYSIAFIQACNRGFLSKIGL
jgi:hypothetical protein